MRKCLGVGFFDWTESRKTEGGVEVGVVESNLGFGVRMSIRIERTGGGGLYPWGVLRNSSVAELKRGHGGGCVFFQKGNYCF